MAWTNWARTAACTPTEVVRPRDESQLALAVAQVARSGGRVKAVGSGHSFSDIACTPATRVSLAAMNRVLRIDQATGLVEVQAGVTINALNRVLAANGRAMPNLGDVGYQTLAGATSTGTHGTGIGLGALHTNIRSMRIVLADGSVRELSAQREPELFAAAKVGLGALGVISSLTLQTVPAFQLHQSAEVMDIPELERRLPDLLAASPHFDFMYEFVSGAVIARSTVRTTTPQRNRPRARALFDDVLVEGYAWGMAAHLSRKDPSKLPRRVAKFPASSRGDFVDRSDRVFITPRKARLRAAEFAFDAADAVRAAADLGAAAKAASVVSGFPLLVRFAAGDDAYLSPSHGRPTAYLCPVVPAPLPYGHYFQLAETVARRYGGRPHWGKLHDFARDELRPLYPRWDAFVAARDELDPTGVFRNGYLDRVLGSPGSHASPVAGSATVEA